MNWDMLEGQWHQVKGNIRAKWGKLGDKDLEVIGGKKEQLLGKLQELYGISKDQAELQVDEWMKKTPDVQK